MASIKNHITAPIILPYKWDMNLLCPLSILFLYTFFHAKRALTNPIMRNKTTIETPLCILKYPNLCPYNS